jgi:hypothetical protein
METPKSTQDIMDRYVPIAPQERSEDCEHNLYALIIFSGMKKVICGDCDEVLK